jgi:hypothetical protein
MRSIPYAYTLCDGDLSRGFFSYTTSDLLRHVKTLNARFQPPLAAEATQERTLEAVGCNTPCLAGSPHDRNRAGENGS